MVTLTVCLPLLSDKYQIDYHASYDVTIYKRIRESMTSHGHMTHQEKDRIFRGSGDEDLFTLSPIYCDVIARVRIHYVSICRVKRVFKGHVNIQEKMSLHDRFVTCRFLNMGKTTLYILRKCPLITVSLEDKFKFKFKYYFINRIT